MMSKIAAAIGMFIGLMFISFFVLSFMAFDAKKVSSLPPSPSVFSKDAGGKLSIENIGSDSIVVRNTGRSVVHTSDVEVYVDGEGKSCIWNFESVAPNSLLVCITSVRCIDEIKVVSGDAQDAKGCPLAPPPLSPPGS